MTDTGPRPFILGVNYWPRRKAMYWWSNFDADEVREELAVIRDLGMDMVRIFLLWDDWQPAPDTVASGALRDLETVCDVAADLGLVLNITFFTGHMSGPSWAPRWMLLQDRPTPPGVRQVVSQGRAVSCGYRNPYADALVQEASELLVSTVVSRFCDHPGVGIWNLGNESDLFACPPDAAAGRSWAREMTALIRSLDPAHAVTWGLHVDSLVKDNGLRVNDVFGEVDLAVMHGYPMYEDWARDPLDPDFVPFLCALTGALGGKEVMMEEFGGCTTPPGQPSEFREWEGYGRSRKKFMASEHDLARYIERVLAGLVDVGAVGAVLWCYADYDPRLHTRPPCDHSLHERFFGLVRSDGTLKPHAEVVRRFAASRPRVTPARRTVTLGCSPGEYYEDPRGHAVRLYDVFLASR